MNRFRNSISILLLITAFAFPHLLFAEFTKEDEREINNYKLTTQKLGQFQKAIKNLIGAIEKNPELLRNLKVQEHPEAGLSELVQLLDSMPDASQAVKESGMSSREYLTFYLALTYAGAGAMMEKAGAKLPAEYSKENVDFVRSHEQELQKLDQDLKTLGELTDDDDTESEEEPDDDSD